MSERRMWWLVIAGLAVMLAGVLIGMAWPGTNWYATGVVLGGLAVAAVGYGLIWRGDLRRRAERNSRDEP